MRDSRPPLCIDLDGTLIRTDLLQESILQYLRESPLHIFHIIMWFLKGRPFLKQKLAEKIEINPALLPYNEKMLEFALYQKSLGTRLFLVTASDGRAAIRIAKHLKIFTDVMASDGHINLRSSAKAEALIKRFGEKKFIYAGNSRHDLPVWRHACAAIAVNTPSLVWARLKRSHIKTKRIHDGIINAFQAVYELISPVKWVRNLLVLPFLIVPLMDLDLVVLFGYVLAFICLSALDSGCRIFRDLFSLPIDRHTEEGREGLLASGAVPIPFGIYVSSVCFLVAFITMYFMPNPMYIAMMLLYGSMTLTYHFSEPNIVKLLSNSFLYFFRVLIGIFLCL